MNESLAKPSSNQQNQPADLWIGNKCHGLLLCLLRLCGMSHSIIVTIGNWYRYPSTTVKSAVGYTDLNSGSKSKLEEVSRAITIVEDMVRRSTRSPWVPSYLFWEPHSPLWCAFAFNSLHWSHFFKEWPRGHWMSDVPWAMTDTGQDWGAGRRRMFGSPVPLSQENSEA